MLDPTVKEFTVQIDQVKGIFRANLRGVLDEVIRLHLNKEYAFLFGDAQIHDDINIQLNAFSIPLTDLEQHQMKRGDVVTIAKRQMCTDEELNVRVKGPEDARPDDFDEEAWEQERIKQRIQRNIKHKYKKTADDFDENTDPFYVSLRQLLTSIPFGKTEITQEEPYVIKHKFELNDVALSEWKRKGALRVIKLISGTMLRIQYPEKEESGIVSEAKPEPLEIDREGFIDGIYLCFGQFRMAERSEGIFFKQLHGIGRRISRGRYGSIQEG